MATDTSGSTPPKRPSPPWSASARFRLLIKLTATLVALALASAGGLIVITHVHFPTSARNFAVLSGTYIFLLLSWGMFALAQLRLVSFWLSAAFFVFIEEASLLLSDLGKPLQASDFFYIFIVIFIAGAEILLFLYQQRRTERVIQSFLDDRIRKPTDLPPRLFINWMVAGRSIMGVDFFPEFWQFLGDIIGRSNPRADSRRLFCEILPRQYFDMTDFDQGDLGVADKLQVPSYERKWPWRGFVILGVSSVLVMTIHILLLKSS